MSTQEYDGTLIMIKSLKSVILQKMYILDRVTNKNTQTKSYEWIKQININGLYHNMKPYSTHISI